MLTVLHIDDDPDLRFLLREFAADEEAGAGLRWLEASGAEEAIALHGAAQPDLILLDYRLGCQDGVALLPGLRAAFSCPIWLVSGVCNDRLAEEARAAGAAGVATKDEVLGQPEQLVSFLRRAASTVSRSAGRS